MTQPWFQDGGIQRRDFRCKGVYLKPLRAFLRFIWTFEYSCKTVLDYQQRPDKNGTMKASVFLLIVSLAAASFVQAQKVFDPPVGGWDYYFDGDDAYYALPNEGFLSFDGTWSHDNSSDQWDGSEIGGDFGDGNRPGGIQVITDGDLNYLRLQVVGDPRDHGYGGEPSNRKIYLVHDLNEDGASDDLLDEGVTLIIRARVPTDGPLDPLHPDGQSATEPYPAEGDGYLPSDGGKGNFVIRQASGGSISFNLTTVADTADGLVSGLSFNELVGDQISGDVNFGDGSERNFLGLKPTEWHEFWITIEPDDSGAGTHVATIYVDGNPAAESFPLTAGNGSDHDSTYLAIGASATPQSCALDLDFIGVKFGAVPPAGAMTGEARLAIFTGDYDYTVNWGGEGTLIWTRDLLEGVWRPALSAKDPYTSIPHGHALFFGVGQPTNLDTVRTEVMAQVDRAILLHQQDGEAAFDVITNGGTYSKGEIYTFVIDSEGLMLAHAANAALVGENLYDLQDSSGAFIVRGIIENATVEGAWLNYMFTNPLSGLEEPKRVWIKKADDLMFVSGYYPDIEEVVQQQVEKAIARYMEAGDDVFDEITESGDYVYGEVYTWAVGTDGINLAHATRPEIVGTDRLQVQDSTGLFIVRQLLEVVTTEGIWYHYRYNNPVTGKEESKRSWAVLFEDIVWVSGYYP